MSGVWSGGGSSVASDISHGSGPHHTSITVAVCVICLLCTFTFAFWFVWRSRYQEPRQVATGPILPVYEEPRMWEVHLEPTSASGLSAKGNKLMPISAAFAKDCRRLVLPHYEADERLDDARDRLQVAVLIAMPSAAFGRSSIGKHDVGLSTLCLGATTIPYDDSKITRLLSHET